MTEKYASQINQDVEPASADEFKPIPIGPLRIWPPVVLAPMAGITNAPFRTLCRRFGAGLYVSEMVTARLLVKRNPKTMKLASLPLMKNRAVCSFTALIRILLARR